LGGRGVHDLELATRSQSVATDSKFGSEQVVWPRIPTEAGCARHRIIPPTARCGPPGGGRSCTMLQFMARRDGQYRARWNGVVQAELGTALFVQQREGPTAVIDPSCCTIMFPNKEPGSIPRHLPLTQIRFPSCGERVPISQYAPETEEYGPIGRRLGRSIRRAPSPDSTLRIVDTPLYGPGDDLHLAENSRVGLHSSEAASNTGTRKELSRKCHAEAGWLVLNLASREWNAVQVWTRSCPTAGSRWSGRPSDSRSPDEWGNER
jgi:hypothetical protein